MLVCCQSRWYRWWWERLFTYTNQQMFTEIENVWLSEVMHAKLQSNRDTTYIWWWWWWFEKLCSPALTARNSHDRASDTPWQTVQFSDHDGTQMLDDSCARCWKIIPGGRSCHGEAARTYRSVLVAGTARSPRAAERRWRRPALSATG